MTAPRDRVDSRRAAILDAAGKLFMTRGFANTTTLDIARAAGVSKRDLYASFPTKDAVLGALVSNRIERMAVAVDLGRPQSRDGALATLSAFAGALVRFLFSADALGLYRLAIAGTDRQPEIGQALVDSGIRATTDRVATYLAEAAAAGHLTLATPPEAARAFLAVAIGATQMQRLLDPRLEPASVDIDAQVTLALAVLLGFERR